MIDLIETAHLMQNDTGAMTAFNEFALAMIGASDVAFGATLRAGEAPVGLQLKDAPQGGGLHVSIAALELLIDQLDIESGIAVEAAPTCGCKAKNDGLDSVDTGGGEADFTTMTFLYSDGGEGGDEPNDDADGDGKPDDPIIVTGDKPTEVDEDDDMGSLPTSGGGETDDSEGGGPGGGGEMIAEETPCVNEAPVGTDVSELNNLAKIAAAKLGTLQDSTGWEWGAFLYRGVDGRLYISEAFTAKHPDSLTGAEIALPDGSHIVGYVHTHPVNDTMDERMLSDDDREFINLIASDSTGSVTGDPNLLAYVVTKDDAGGRTLDSYRTYVYDKSERSSDDPGCTL